MAVRRDSESLVKSRRLQRRLPSQTHN